MIPEFTVLFAVQNFQERGKCISLIVCADFVNFIQQHDRIFHSGRADAGGNTSGHGAYISFPVPADLRLVPHTAQRNTDKWFLHSPCQRFRDRSFSGTRRSRQTENGTVPFFRQSADCQELQNPFFYLFQPVVILIQYLPRVGNIMNIPGGFIPGHFKKCLYISADYPAFSRRIERTFKSFDFFLKLFFHLFRSLQLLQSTFKFLRIGYGGFLAQLFTDKLQLLSQNVFPLMFIHAFFDFSLDFFFDIHNLDFIDQSESQLFVPLPEIRFTQQLLLIRIIEWNIGCDFIYQLFQSLYLKKPCNRLF